GFDPKFKLAIVASHAYGLYIPPDAILNIGIDKLGAPDIQFAREKNFRIKLVPTAREINDRAVILYVLPKLISSDNILYNVENEYNGVQVKAAFADEQFFYGKGAGGHPTGSAVLSDIAALRYGYRYEYKRHIEAGSLSYSTDWEINVYLRYDDDALIDQLGFSSISERYYAADFKYVIGRINLRNIMENKNIINQRGAFIAEIS